MGLFLLNISIMSLVCVSNYHIYIYNIYIYHLLTMYATELLFVILVYNPHGIITVFLH